MEGKGLVQLGMGRKGTGVEGQVWGGVGRVQWGEVTPQFFLVNSHTKWAEIRMVRWMCGIKLQDRVLSSVERETRIRRHNLGTTAKQVVMVWACAAKKTIIV